MQNLNRTYSIIVKDNFFQGMLLQQYFQQKMGNSNQVSFKNQNVPPKQRNQVPRQKRQLKQPQLFSSNRNSNIKNNSIKLSDLRDSLNIKQCFSTLFSLIQQYYSLFKIYKKVSVNDHLCQISQLGQITVNQIPSQKDSIFASNYTITHSFVSIISQVITIVEGLAIEIEELQTPQCKMIKQSLLSKIYKFHKNDDILYHEIIQTLNQFLQIRNIKCNLIQAYMRHRLNAPLSYIGHYQPQQNTPYLAGSRYEMEYSDSQSNFSVHYNQFVDRSIKRNEETITKDSQFVNQMKKEPLKTGLRYKHKVVKTEGENYYSIFHNRMQSDQLQGIDCYRSQKEGCFKKNNQKKIAHQYSLSILNVYQGKDLKHKENYDNLHRKRQNGSFNKLKKAEFKKESSRQQFSQMKLKNQDDNLNKSYAKSMLQHLARSVSIMDQPGSRDYIC